MIVLSSITPWIKVCGQPAPDLCRSIDGRLEAKVGAGLLRNSDLEFVEPGEPAEYTLDVTTKEDLNIRVIKSGACEIKIPSFRISVDSTMGSEGFVSNVEGVLDRFLQQINLLKDDEELEKEQKKKLKKQSAIYMQQAAISLRLAIIYKQIAIVYQLNLLSLPRALKLMKSMVKA